MVTLLPATLDAAATACIMPIAKIFCRRPSRLSGYFDDKFTFLTAECQMARLFTHAVSVFPCMTAVRFTSPTKDGHTKV